MSSATLEHFQQTSSWQVISRVARLPVDRTRAVRKDQNFKTLRSTTVLRRCSLPYRFSSDFLLGEGTHRHFCGMPPSIQTVQILAALGHCVESFVDVALRPSSLRLCSSMPPRTIFGPRFEYPAIDLVVRTSERPQRRHRMFGMCGGFLKPLRIDIVVNVEVI
jgi:hypothetical protein